MRIFIFANRTDPNSVGGLTSLLNDHMSTSADKEEVFLVGWSGNQVATEEERQSQSNVVNGMTYMTVDLTEFEYQEAYCGFQNRYLWPLSHKLTQYGKVSAHGLKANLKISELYISLAEKWGELSNEDLVLVQDYHLIPLGAQLKQRGYTNKIAFYLHIPMLQKETVIEGEKQGLYKYQEIQELLSSMQAYDYIGFQRPLDIENFLGFLGKSSDDSEIEPYKLYSHNGFRICFNPVGIDAEAYQELSAGGKPEYIEKFKGKIAIILAGRYDYTKGHLLYLQALEQLIKENPKYAQQVKTIFIGGATRNDIPEYQEYQDQLLGFIKYLNETYDKISDGDPVVLEMGKVDRGDLAKILGSAKEILNSGGRQIIMCPSYMDGQNLIVHEAIAASEYNFICTSIGSGCVEVIGEENAFVLYENNDPDKQKGITEIKEMIQVMIEADVEDQIQRNTEAQKRVKEQFQGSNWLPQMVNQIKIRKILHIFDVDGTISNLQVDPNASFLEKDFIDYIIRAENKYPHTNVILTGREDKRTNELTTSHSIDKIMAPVLQIMPLSIISAHGLVCYTRDNKIQYHPILQESLELVKLLHQKIDEFMAIHPGFKLFIEKKVTGVNMNANQESLEQQQELFRLGKEFFEPIIKGSHLYIAQEHGSLEVRPLVGKREGLYYFIEQGIIPTGLHIAFYCDSLGPHGTDRLLAESLLAQGHTVIQVLNGKEKFGKVKQFFKHPRDLCKLLKQRAKLL